MVYTLGKKKINIPDSEIAKSMKVLKLTQDEAIQMYLEDEGYLENEEVEALTAKAKVNKISHEAKSEKPRKKTTRERKPDEEKEKIIQIIAKALENEGISAQITNKSKLIEFNIGQNGYKLDLIKRRPPKNS